MIIDLSSEVVNLCKEFAKKRMDSSSLYKKRGESDLIKIENDILIGSLGEFAAFEYLEMKGIKVTRPDLSIHETARKSYSADLVGENHRFHVKTQTQSSIKRYGESYLLQRTDPLLRNATDMDYFVFVGCDYRANEIVSCKIFGCMKAKDVVENLGECRVMSYRITKKAIYLEDLKDKGFVILQEIV